MSIVITDIKTHDDTVRLSEGVRQAAVAAAGNNQASVNTAELAHFRTCLASAIANKCGAEPWTTAIKSMGLNT
jgi:Mg-chelatase subunit ChlD